MRIVLERPDAQQPADVQRQPADVQRQPPPTLDATRAAQGRAVRARGQNTVRRLLTAGLAEFSERSFQDVTVDHIVRRARASHGTFYLYFANKDEFFGVLAQEALGAMDAVTDEFPVVTPDEAGRAALREWVSSFCDAYQAHAAVIKILSQADVVGRSAWEDGLKHLFRLAEAVSLGMTVGVGDGASAPAGSAQLNALACLMMLERVNYLLSSGIELPRAALVDRMTAIIVAAFHPTGDGGEGAGAR